MAQLKGTIDFNLSKGFSWNAVLQVDKTSLPRRKVIYEMAKAGAAGPRLIIQLNVDDALVLRIDDRAGTTYQTQPIDSSHFAGRPIYLRVEVVPDVSIERQNAIRLALRVYINGELKSERDVSGTFDEQVTGSQSIGANLEGTDPAKFRMSELIMFAQPLGPEDASKLAKDMQNYYGIRGAI